MLADGTGAPAFVLPSTNGGSVRLADLVGTRAAIVFVRPGCPHCERLLAELSGVEAGDGGQILVVTAAGVESAGKLQSDHGLALPVLADSTGSTASAYAVSVVPCAYLLDARGHIASSARGHPAARELLDKVL
jgi:peroxiredoxin